MLSGFPHTPSFSAASLPSLLSLNRTSRTPPSRLSRLRADTYDCSMVTSLGDMSALHTKMESLGPVHHRNRCRRTQPSSPRCLFRLRPSCCLFCLGRGCFGGFPPSACLAAGQFFCRALPPSFPLSLSPLLSLSLSLPPFSLSPCLYGRLYPPAAAALGGLPAMKVIRIDTT